MQVNKEGILHKNNFDSLRFLFASFVIVTHSFALTGNESEEFLAKLTEGQVSFSYIGLRGFFIISGFLIYQSLERSKSIPDFLWKRMLRVFPGLIVLNLVTVFLIGPVISTLSAGEFFSYKDTWLFFTHAVSLFFNNVYKCLPGVFLLNTHGCEVNGSLWTITYEFLFYVCLIVLFFVPGRIKVLLLLAALFLIYLVKRIYVYPYVKYEYYFFSTSVGLKAVCDFGTFFLAGSIFASLGFSKLSAQQLRWIFFASAGIIIILLCVNIFPEFSMLLVPCVLSAGLLKFNFLPFLKKTGDISYGTYLYGFLVQQILIQYFHPTSYALIGLSLLISYLLGILSWKFIEKPSLAYKKAFAKKREMKSYVLDNE